MTEFFPLLVEVPEQSRPISREEVRLVVNDLYPKVKALCSNAMEKFKLSNPLFLLRIMKVKRYSFSGLEETYLWDLFVLDNNHSVWIGGER
jgi:hypothetical protein